MSTSFDERVRNTVGDLVLQALKLQAENAELREQLAAQALAKKPGKAKRPLRMVPA